ncbi:MAG: beta-glucosidase [Clostridiales bacterium]|jgi:beta-glucosidase|nr:beta-glucosidase [Clostridiales bacterium]
MPAYSFPKDFLWGAASASYQTEGGAGDGGKGESIWDRFSHIPGNIADGANGDAACDFCHRFEEDISLLRRLGLKAYRMSASWPRIFPQGAGEINREGVEFYRRVLKCLRDNGIKSAVTIYHWDLPQALQNRGGWANREIVGWFKNYAEALYAELGDLVDMWITVNEPIIAAMNGHWLGEHAPGYRDYSHALLAAHHMLMAHGAAVKAYRQTGLKAEIGCSMNMQMEYPANPDDSRDVEAARIMMLHQNRFYLDAVYKGRYPAEFLDRLKARGVTLPAVLDGDMETISQKLDFFGINTYFSEYVRYDETRWPVFASAVKTERPKTSLGWELCPDGFFDLMKWTHDNYRPDKIVITENGAAGNDWVNSSGRVEDPGRREYLKQYLIEVNRAIGAGINIAGYFVWSFCDNFEWAQGLSARFGLVHVDYKTQRRTIKDSAYWLSDVVKNSGFDA